MADFEEYQKMYTEVENHIMTRLHPTLEGLLNGQADTNKLIAKMSQKIDQMYTAYSVAKKVGLFGEWLATNVYKIILTLGSLGIAIAGIKDGGVMNIIKKIIGR